MSDRFWAKVSAADTNADGGIFMEELDLFCAEQIDEPTGDPVAHREHDLREK